MMFSESYQTLRRVCFINLLIVVSSINLCKKYKNIKDLSVVLFEGEKEYII